MSKVFWKEIFSRIQLTAFENKRSAKRDIYAIYLVLTKEWIKNDICGALRDLVPFIQFKKRKKHLMEEC